jgi:hypothetical protein
MIPAFYGNWFWFLCQCTRIQHAMVQIIQDRPWSQRACITPLAPVWLMHTLMVDHHCTQACMLLLK